MGGQFVKTTKTFHAIFLIFCIGFSLPALSQISQLTHPPALEVGFHSMYNVQFAEAHAAFVNYMRQHPEDPMGPVSDAAAYLFSEFHRLGVLDVDLFTSDSNYRHRKRSSPDPTVKAAFDSALDKTNQLADSILIKHPDDADALLAKTLAYGLRADYTSLVERKDIAGFQYTKSGSVYAHRLLQVDPKAYDAYLAIGMENYILGLKPAPVRWLLQMAGGETDRTLGEHDLELTATQGHYLAPLAQLLLAVAAIRDNNKLKAKQLLSSLAQEFPNNPMYAAQLAKIG